jgi:uncharacterized lipoprotein YddW (UPF0748 family)
MIHRLAIAFLLLLLLPAPAEIPAVPREMRAAWIATVFNIDWPSKAGLSKAEQQAELRSQLDTAADLGLNTLLFQIRSACDALYESKHDPWSVFLTGVSGQSPGYDPLKFAIEEAHLRGLELHAWFNPFRAKCSAKELAANHITKRHPEWIMHYGKNVWLDPGLPEVREYTLSIVGDLLTRYDLDGIHIDDYFYPYPDRNPDKSPKPFTDDATRAKYGAGQDPIVWRRANIDDFVSKFYSLVKNRKPSVKVGISPFGIWQPGTPAGITGILNAHNELAADAKKWINLGWADYFAPQLYWKIDPPDQSFPVLLNWWQAENKLKRPMCPGLDCARIEGKEDGRPASEITRQIDLTRGLSGPLGHCLWGFKAVRSDKGGIKTLLKSGSYAESKALPPASPWLGKEVPAAVNAVVKNGMASLTINAKARWLTQQTKEADGKWRLMKVLPATTKTLAIGAGKHALRWISPTGVEGPATEL